MKKYYLLAAFCILSISVFPQSVSKTKVLVLGTPHLDHIDNLQPAYLKRVVDSLEKMNFDVVAIEQMPTDLLLDIQCRDGSQWKDLYNSFKKRFEAGSSYQETINLSFEEASARLNELNQKKDISESDRIIYINSLICTFDIWSAVLHYQKLEEKSGLNKDAISLLDNYAGSLNEINLIGLQIANQSECRKVYYIDNMQDETILLSEFPSFIDDYQSNAESLKELIEEISLFQKTVSLEKEAIKNEDLYDLYTFYNSENYMKEDVQGQWGLWFKTNFDSKSDRSRYSLWEMRNLMITANILKTVASNPEKKILVIIGASHKSFIEKYLKQIPDIELLSF